MSGHDGCINWRLRLKWWFSSFVVAVIALYSQLQAALLATDPTQKCVLTQALHQAATAGELQWDTDAPCLDFARAGQPDKPVLVDPKQVKPRKMATPEGYAALLHAVAHIEFNAINLALDAAYRFRHIAPEFQLDWLRVAAEEAQHFCLMRERLQAHGFDYGDFEAHNHLWDMAYKTAYDPLLRMALVPRVLEARGLDVTPAMRAKIEQKGDAATCAVLDIIYRDEVGHVKVVPLFVPTAWLGCFKRVQTIDTALRFVFVSRPFKHRSA